MYYILVFFSLCKSEKTSSLLKEPELQGSLDLLELIFESLYYIFEFYLYKSLSGESANLQVLFILLKVRF